ncbi:hypothetical protein K466DRAFT_606224 [Polyporus arcularius HHB13444]|uniref:Uncharacterized protein n=1 Tax=Polyporus arcularius HHB13444 TaxID=1314778 RepID=A0A5C3NNV9_9APHY|nr:hypothetical protein K466DRAFT_606224 [Polyporus arcularius HHB13444]
MHSLPRPKQLVELKIDVGSSDRPLELPRFDGLEALDAALQPQLFKDLQAVQLHVTYRKEEGDPDEGPALTEPMLAVIKNKLPKLFARNIINVSAYAYKREMPPTPIPAASAYEVRVSHPLARAVRVS